METENSSSSDILSPVPEILAPVGGREQFFAALHSGADAVFLGLKNFNARARAENFTLDDLRELVPLARTHGMHVLVTMNILIKNSELSDLIETLSALEDIGVHAIIVQDLGLARIARTYFPNLRLHASTQMAVHNLDGVREAMKYGFKRVVLARELTAVEIKKIRAAIPKEDVELEAFCHGSLCYSYSGLCFFSGAEDARSGNRGECAYTCRKPYKIVNEPGHGFLFSMKDLNTVEHLPLLVDAGVDTLKIEGRKKDAQYVSSVVQTYRQRLDQIYGRPTLRRAAPRLAHDMTQDNASSPEALKEQLSLTFQRGSTSFFLKGRYFENVIDLNNPTHKGQEVGEVLDVQGRLVSLLPQCTLERFDGIRIDPAERIFHSAPQHGSDVRNSISGVVEKYDNRVCQFSLRSMFCEGKSVTEASAGKLLKIEIPEDIPLPRKGDVVMRTRSDALRRTIEKISHPEGDVRLRAHNRCDITIALTAHENELTLSLSALKNGRTLLTFKESVPALRPQKGTGTLETDLRENLSVLGNIQFSIDTLTCTGDSAWFVPRSRIKEIKRKLEALLPDAHAAALRETLQAAHAEVVQSRLKQENAPTSLKPALDSAPTRLAVKVDRLEYLPWLKKHVAQSSTRTVIQYSELVFEPKRAFLPNSSFEDTAKALRAFQEETGLPVRIAFPTVLRAWDEPLMKRWMNAFRAEGLTHVEIGNIGVLSMLERWGMNDLLSGWSSDFTLYALNSEAIAHWSARGAEMTALSIEDDLKNLRRLLSTWSHESKPQIILFKDTPLFIAESCSLTALHNGCPTNAVCGYRTLEIENDAGERFYVAHESCKSVVYGKQAYGISQHRHNLEALGVKDFRVDFLTRSYDENRFLEILSAVENGEAVSETHTANFERTLL
jgi:putative protease